MKIEIPNELKKLSKIFFDNGKNLYVVGGYVRDFLNGIENPDIDVASNCSTEEIKEILPQEYNVVCVNKKLGTIHITKDNFCVEHTTFRMDFYNEGGAHSPEKVEFVTTPNEDAFRRDFTCNSIYYDIENDEILDYFGGVEDAKKHILRAIVTPEYVFGSDGLRLLRLLRFVSEHNYTIDYETQKGAKEFAYQLEDISPSRIFEEFTRLLDGDNFFKAIDYCEQFGFFKYIFKDIIALPLKNKTFDEILDDEYYVYFTETTPKEYRLIAFMIDIINLLLKYCDNSFEIFDIASFILDYQYFACPKKIAKKIIELSVLLSDINNCTDEDNIKALLLDADENLKDFIELLKIVKNTKIVSVYEKLKAKNIALNLKSFVINGRDIMALNLEPKQINNALNDMLLYSVLEETNDKNKILEELNKRLKGGRYD